MIIFWSAEQFFSLQTYPTSEILSLVNLRDFREDFVYWVTQPLRS